MKLITVRYKILTNNVENIPHIGDSIGININGWAGTAECNDIHISKTKQSRNGTQYDLYEAVIEASAVLEDAKQEITAEYVVNHKAGNNGTSGDVQTKE